MHYSMWQDIFKLGKHKTSLEILKSIPFFTNLTIHDLKKINRLMHIRNYSEGEVVFHEDEPGESMYIVLSGEVTIRKLIGNKVETIATLIQGNFFGEASLVEDNSRSAAAISTKNTHLLGFFKADLMNLISRDPRLSSLILLQLSMVLAKRLRLQSESMQLHG